MKDLICFHTGLKIKHQTLKIQLQALKVKNIFNQTLISNFNKSNAHECYILISMYLLNPALSSVLKIL